MEDHVNCEHPLGETCKFCFGNNDEDESSYDDQKETCKIVSFEQYNIDLFICEDGGLGMSVQNNMNDSGIVDIFVDKNNLTVHSDRPKTPASSS